MKTEQNMCITREKHLDHMVKVVPFIVVCYAFQCFVILKMSPTEFSTISLSVLGGFIALMITGFIYYDLKHQVTFDERTLSINFMLQDITLGYDEIWFIEVKDPGQTFSNLTITTATRSYTFYFIDNAEKIKAMMEDKKRPLQKAA